MANHDAGAATPNLKTTIKRGQTEVEKKAKALQRLKVQYVAVDSIKPNSYNPNRQDDNDFQLLLRSMREDGFTQPIVVQEGTNEIVDGEHRWRAAREIGLPTIPVVFVDMTPEQMRIATLRHNRARGSEDIDLSTQLLRDLRELGALDWAKDSLMMSDEELQKLIDDVPAPDALAGEDFNEAWVPTKNATDMEAQSDREVVSMTPAAEKQQKEFKEKAAKAKTEQERVQIEFQLRDTSYRLILTFKDEEADVVRQILEPKPAEKILALCKARYTA